MRIPMWVRVVFGAELAVTAIGGWLIAPYRGYDALAGVFVTAVAIVVVSGCVGFALGRGAPARRLLLINSTSLPAIGLFTFWLRATEDAPAPWYGYALLWSVMVALSLVPTVVAYAFARVTASP